MEQIVLNLSAMARTKHEQKRIGYSVTSPRRVRSIAAMRGTAS
jgi:hypothetical protein